MVAFRRFTGGSVITIPSSVVARISHPSATGLRIGIMWATGSIAELIGPPIAGALLKQQDENISYLGCQVFGGINVLTGAIFLTIPAWHIHKHGAREQQSNESSL